MRYALVTGGSRGIGRAICQKLAEMGYFILINYLSNKTEAENTLHLVRELGSDGELLQFDVADYDHTLSTLTCWQEAHKGEYIEVLINNAGIRNDSLMMWMEYDNWKKVLNTHLDGFFSTTQPLLKAMLVGRFGRIVNIVSLSGIKGLPGQVNYSAAKGGLIAATKALAQEVAKKGVTVNAIAPGYVSTEMTEGLDEKELKKLIPAGRFGTVDEVADLAAFLVSNKASYITGEVISINGGLYT
ncbi:MAG: 3-oxoacyl-ACP reductase FabG [Rikenellaceae bacterium]